MTKDFLDRSRSELETILHHLLPQIAPGKSDSEISFLSSSDEGRILLADLRSTPFLTGLVFRAIERISSGDYGDCLSCGEFISVQRLVALPWAELCLNCQEITAEMDRLERTDVSWRFDASTQQKPWLCSDTKPDEDAGRAAS